MRDFMRICVVVGVLVWGVGLGAKEAVYFMPQEQKAALNALKNTLGSAKKTIHIAIYNFTNKEIAKVLRDRARNGVQIHIIYDRESNLKNPHSTIGYLGALRNISVCLLAGKKAGQKNYFGIMHQKLAIVDGEQVVFGSANWSKNAFENNYEILFVSDKKALVEKAENAFGEMLRDCKAY